MRLTRARVQQYRSIRDSGWFDLQHIKTILVGPNEAGKTVLLQALQQLNPPKGLPGFDPLRDYPRSQYSEIASKSVDPAAVQVVTGVFDLEDADKQEIPNAYRNCKYVVWRCLDNKAYHRLDGAPAVATYAEIRNDLTRLVAHVDPRVPPSAGAGAAKPGAKLTALTAKWEDSTRIEGDHARGLRAWLDSVVPYVDEGNAAEEARHASLRTAASIEEQINTVLRILGDRTPVFVFFSNYFRVHPLIHLAHLAQRASSNMLDDTQYDYGNMSLLKFLGFTPQQLSELGQVGDAQESDRAALQKARDQVDSRGYQLNAASLKLTTEVNAVWLPDRGRGEASRLRLIADGQYLKVVVEDELGVEVELNQRSEGFQWLVSFFVVFFAEAADRYKGAILLLDEPGLSLHGLKQREFRKTLSRLAERNQTIYTTHSPFLVGPDELDLVRVVEMTDRKVGTKVLTTVTAHDNAGLLPLQEALGYDMAQSLFGSERNLVVESLTDYWYIEAMAHLLREARLADLDQNISLIPAASAGKVVYFATIVYAQSLNVAALLDSDTAGERAANQDTLVQALGQQRILRTKDAYKGAVSKPMIEDLLRDTLVKVGKAELKWDVAKLASSQAQRPILDVFAEAVGNDFSRYRLAKAFLRWTRNHTANDLQSIERERWQEMIAIINRALP